MSGISEVESFYEFVVSWYSSCDSLYNYTVLLDEIKELRSWNIMCAADFDSLMLQQFCVIWKFPFVLKDDVDESVRLAYITELQTVFSGRPGFSDFFLTPEDYISCEPEEWDGNRRRILEHKWRSLLYKFLEVYPQMIFWARLNRQMLEFVDIDLLRERCGEDLWFRAYISELEGRYVDAANIYLNLCSEFPLAFLALALLLTKDETVERVASIWGSEFSLAAIPAMHNFVDHIRIPDYKWRESQEQLPFVILLTRFFAGENVKDLPRLRAILALFLEADRYNLIMSLVSVAGNFLVGDRYFFWDTFFIDHPDAEKNLLKVWRSWYSAVSDFAFQEVKSKDVVRLLEKLYLQYMQHLLRAALTVDIAENEVMLMLAEACNVLDTNLVLVYMFRELELKLRLSLGGGDEHGQDRVVSIIEYLNIHMSFVGDEARFSKMRLGFGAAVILNNSEDKDHYSRQMLFSDGRDVSGALFRWRENLLETEAIELLRWCLFPGLVICDDDVDVVGERLSEEEKWSNVHRFTCLWLKEEGRESVIAGLFAEPHIMGQVMLFFGHVYGRLGGGEPHLRGLQAKWGGRIQSLSVGFFPPAEKFGTISGGSTIPNGSGGSRFSDPAFFDVGDEEEGEARDLELVG